MIGLEMGVNDNDNIVLLKLEYFSNLVIENPEDKVLNLIKKQKTNMDTYVGA